MSKITSIIVLFVSLTCHADTPQADAARQELERQQGIWLVTSFRWDGKESPGEIVNTIVREVDGDHVVWKRNGKNFAGTTIELDPRVEPKAIDVLPDGGPLRGSRVLGIYKLDGDILTICMAGKAQARPKEFQAGKGSGQTLVTFRRKRPGE